MNALVKEHIEVGSEKWSVVNQIKRQGHISGRRLCLWEKKSHVEITPHLFQELSTIITALRRQRQKDCEFEDSMGYIVWPYLKTHKPKNPKGTERRPKWPEHRTGRDWPHHKASCYIRISVKFSFGDGSILKDE
jgi:hypothetical protein